MMNQVRIYNTICYKAYMMSEQGEYMSLEPWGKNTPYYEGESDNGTLYELPEGCSVAKSQGGSLEIYSGNVHCLFSSKNGIPKIYLNGEIVSLKKAGA
ncbi:MAG: hypothetical protein RSJ40_10520 [Acetivibrio sp.]